MDVKFLRPYMQVAHLLALVHHAHCLVSPRIHLKVYNCDPPMPAVSQNDTPIQGILWGGNDRNVRAIDCTDALRKPPFGWKSIYNPTEALSSWNAYVLCCKTFHNGLANIMHCHNTVEIPTPNKWLIILYSTLVPSLRGNGVLTASLLSRWGCNSRDKNWKVALFTQKICFNSLSLQFPAILFQNELFLYLTQTVLRYRYAVDSRRDMDSERSCHIIACAVLWRQLRAS